MDFGNLNMRLGGSQRGSGPSTPASPYLDSVLDSVVFELDATVDESVAEAGKWKSLIAAPADGVSQQSDWTFDAVDLTLTGEGADRHWGDFTGYMVLDVADAEASPAFTKSLHKTAGPDFWVALAIRYKPSTRGMGFSTGLGSLNNYGIAMRSGANDQLRFQQHGDSSGATHATPNNYFSDAADHLFIVSINRATNQITLWNNNKTGVTAAMTFAASTNDPIDRPGLYHRGDESFAPPAGFRGYAAALGTGTLTDETAGLIFDMWSARHDRAYVPE